MPPITTIKSFQNDPYEQYTRKVASAESGGSTTAKNPFGAAGLFQFVPSTWRNLTQKYNLNYSQDDRLDPEKSKQVMKLFTEENKKQLSKRLGRQPDDYELYLAHGFGAAGAGRLIEGVTKNPNIRTDQFFSPIILKQNRALLYNKDGSAKTLGDISNHFKAKMSAPVTRYTNSEKQITPQETVQNLQEVNSRLTDLVFTKELPNFAGTSYIPDEDENIQKLEEKQAEKEIIREKEVIVQQAPQEESQPIQEDTTEYYVDPNQTYAEIDSFLQMQKGGTFSYRRPTEINIGIKDTTPQKEKLNFGEVRRTIEDKAEINRTGNLVKPRSKMYSDNERRNFDGDTKKYFESAEKILDGNEYQRLLDLQYRNGNPEISFENKGLPFTGKRPNYNPFNNTISLPGLTTAEDYFSPDSYLEEISHAGQDNLIQSVKFLTNDIPAYIQGKSPYEIKGTVEYETHKEIAPKNYQYLYDHRGDREYKTLNELNNTVLGAYQKGGTLYVDNANDPRYQAYQDSLYLYEENRQTKEDMQKRPLVYMGSLRDVDNSNNGRIFDMSVTEDDNGRQITGINPISRTTFKNTIKNPIQGRPDINTKVSIGNYKKPEQTVVIKNKAGYQAKAEIYKQQREIQNTASKVEEQGVAQVYNNIVPQASLEVLPNAQMPNSFSLSEYNERMNNAQGYGSGRYDENADILKAERALDYQEKYNQDIERRYNNPEAQNNPKAQERYNTLRNYLNITPNYQIGGEIPTSPLGMWQYPNQMVRVPSGNITMNFMKHPIEAISEQTGERVVLRPNENYSFKNTTSVIEKPIRL